MINGLMLRKFREDILVQSREKLARRIGVSWQTIRRWETNESTPSPLAMRTLARLLRRNGIRPSDILGSSVSSDERRFRRVTR